MWFLGVWLCFVVWGRGKVGEWEREREGYKEGFYIIGVMYKLVGLYFFLSFVFVVFFFYYVVILFFVCCYVD